MDSPGFRPAFNDLTNEPALPDTPSAMREKDGQGNDGGGGVDIKKRKSLGRRVSFAAKAKVR